MSATGSEIGLPASWEQVPERFAGLHVHPVGARTWILRQSLTSHYEAPFMYLLAGDHGALLVDTGAGGIPLRRAVDALVGETTALTVINTHGHADHVQGNRLFESRPATRMLGRDRARLCAELGIDSWPDGRGRVDLGGRIVAVIPTPGHHPEHVALHDPELSVLLTGDLLYAGRLYVRDPAAFVDSLERLRAVAPVRWVLGSHIELSRAGEEFADGSIEHPNEGALELPAAALSDALAALASMGGQLQRRACSRFVIVPV